MSKTLKKCLAIFLSATLLLCTLGIQSFAVEENGSIIGKKYNTLETAIEVTGDFTATIIKDYRLYKFTPGQSGYYRVSGDTEAEVWGVYLNVYDSEMNYFGDDNGSFSQNVSETSFDAFLNLKEGETYYFKISLYYEDCYFISPVSVEVTMDFLGSITGATLVSPPDKLTYIRGIDEYDSSSIDYVYYEFFFDITGASADVTFSQGQTVTICDYALGNAFEKSYDSEKCHLGENTVYFKLGETVMFSFVITLIENPVESIEIVRLPDKTSYTYGIDGRLGYHNFYPATDYTGLQIKINYTGGTSKTVDWENGEYYGSGILYVDGYPLSVSCYGASEPGEAAVEVNYLTKTAEFNISINSPSFREKLSILFSDDYWEANEYLQIIIQLPYILFHAPIEFFKMLFKLIKM